MLLRDTLKFNIGQYVLAPLEMSQAEHLADYQIRNRERFAPYSPQRSETFYTPRYWRRARKKVAAERRASKAFRWVLLNQDDVIAQINLDQVTGGVMQSAVLGYSLDERFEGHGLMTHSLERIIGFAFNTLELHRINAAHVPENERSAAVLKRLGFEKEGFARSYLKLNGKWRDHVLLALINPTHEKQRASRSNETQAQFKS